jgi:hypothetical protein
MKYIYVKPSTVIVEANGECLLNSGSVVNYDGTPAGNLGNGNGDGTPGDKGTIWGDAKGNSSWDDSEDDE